MRALAPVFALLAAFNACQRRQPNPAREPVAMRLARGSARAVPGLIERASVVLPARWVVDFYGARQAGPYLAFAWAPLRPPADEESARVATRALAVVDTRTGDVRTIPVVRGGWAPSVVGGADDWILVRERRQQPASACDQNPDCWSWALFAYQLPDRTPQLLASSVAPEAQTHMPEPRAEADTFVWLQGNGPGRPLSLRRWARGQRSAAQVIATVEEARASPFLSLSGRTAWLDERDPAGGPPRLRAVGAKEVGAGAIWTFPAMAHFPVVAVRNVAFVGAGESPRSVRIAALEGSGGSIGAGREVAAALDVWDLAWLDDAHLVIAGSEGVEVRDVRDAGRRVAAITGALATAARTGDGHLVIVTRERERDVVRSYTVEAGPRG